MEATEQSKVKKDLANAIYGRSQRMAEYRSGWEPHWQEIADYCLPRKATFNRTVTAGSKNMEKVYDSIGIWCSEQLAAALHGLLTNPALTWFKLLPEDPGLFDDQDSLMWLEIAERVIYRIFGSTESNFGSQIHECYLDLVNFGTAIVYLEEIPTWPIIRFSARHLGECYIAEGKDGLIDTLYRRFKMTARVAEQEFGSEALGPAVRKQLERNRDAEVEFLHAVQPRDERQEGKIDAQNKLFASVYMSVEDKWILRERGFDEFPYLVPRWSKMVGETYGRSPSMTALPDIKMVNAMAQVIIRAAQKAVDPPLMVPDDGFFLPVKTRPASLNFYRAGSSDRIEALQFEGRVDIGVDQINQRHEAILRAYYLDQMKLQKEKVEMTRYEAETRNQENMRMMSPTIGRLEMELLGQLIDRTFTFVQRAGLLPRPPEKLRNQNLRIEYVSPIARAQRSGEAQAFQAAMSMVLEVGKVRPDILESVNWDKAVRRTPDWFGLPHDLIVPVAEVKAKQEQNAQVQQAQQAATIGREGAAGAKDAAMAMQMMMGGGKQQ